MKYDLFVLDRRDFDKFVGKLDKHSKIRLARDISFLKDQGLKLEMPFAKKIDSQLYELRTSGKQRVRIFYTIKGSQIYLVHWFIKKSQKIPAKELATASRRLTLI